MVTVTDQCPGAPNTPAIADEDQKAWMEYLYMQQPMPTDAKGVEVVISVLDPNSNTYEVGRTTSDANGMFKLTFTPEVPGTYSVIAKFEGSKSYGSSFSETAISVDEAPPQPTQQPVVSPPPDQMYVLGTGVAIIIAIAIPEIYSEKALKQTTNPFFFFVKKIGKVNISQGI